MVVHQYSYWHHLQRCCHLLAVAAGTVGTSSGIAGRRQDFEPTFGSTVSSRLDMQQQLQRFAAAAEDLLMRGLHCQQHQHCWQQQQQWWRGFGVADDGGLFAWHMHCRAAVGRIGQFRTLSHRQRRSRSGRCHLAGDGGVVGGGCGHWVSPWQRVMPTCC